MHRQIIANKRNTVFIIIGFVIFIAIIGCAFSWLNHDWTFLISFSVIAIIYALIQYFFAGKLATMMTGAHEVDKNTQPRLYGVVEKLAQTAKLPMPKVYLIQDSAPNAFATGRNPEHAIVAATTGLLEIMDDTELTAVMAHEMSHVKNYDIRVSMIVFGLVCVVGLISDLGLRMLFYSDRNSEERSPIGLIIALFTAIVAPIAASLAQMAVSRQREYLADSSAANLMHEPKPMIDALRKLEAHSRPMRQQNIATEALFIANPLRKSFISKIFSTHPPIEKRIERLEHVKN